MQVRVVRVSVLLRKKIIHVDDTDFETVELSFVKFVAPFGGGSMDNNPDLTLEGPVSEVLGTGFFSISSSANFVIKDGAIIRIGPFFFLGFIAIRSGVSE